MGSINPDRATECKTAPMSDIEAVKAYAKQVTKKLQADGYQPSGLYTYTNRQGDPICYVAKLTKQSSGDKQFRPISWGSSFQTKDADWSSAYPEGEGKKPLYNLADITYRQPNQSQVWIVEGEKDADNLKALGLLATTSKNGANGVASTHWQPLARRKCILWRDNDEAGQSYADDIIEQLEPLGCDIQLVDVDKLNLANKGDASDWIDKLKADKSNITHDELKQMLESLPLIGHGSGGVTDDAGQQDGDTGGGELTDEQVEALISELAELNDLSYERRRGDAAKLIGIRASMLDKLVKEARKELEASNTDLQCNEVIQPHSEPVDGAQLLDDIVALVDRFIVCEPTTSHAVALWVMFTWCIDAFAIAPIACITAPAMRCGKTELLTLMGKMVKRPQEASFINPAPLFRIVDEYQPTLLIDEADAFMAQDEDMRGLINLGHTRGKQVLRCVGDDNQVKGFNVFGAKVISGILKPPSTIVDRSVMLELRRKLPSEKRDKQRHLSSEVTDLLKTKLARWAHDHIERLADTRPALPKNINDRAQDNWEPLLAIASLCSDEWVNRATYAAVTLSGVLTDEPTTTEQLLGDIQAVFDKRKCERIFTHALLDELCNDSEAPWSTYNFRSNDKKLSARQLSKLLGQYGIKSKDLRMGNDVKKGYERRDFLDAFSRYLSDTPFLSATTLQVNDNKGYRENLSATQSTFVADKKTLQVNNHEGCSVVADKIPLHGQNTQKEGKNDLKNGSRNPPKTSLKDMGEIVI